MKRGTGAEKTTKGTTAAHFVKTRARTRFDVRGGAVSSVFCPITSKNESPFLNYASVLSGHATVNYDAGVSPRPPPAQRHASLNLPTESICIFKEMEIKCEDYTSDYFSRVLECDERHRGPLLVRLTCTKSLVKNTTQSVGNMPKLMITKMFILVSKDLD